MCSIGLDKGDVARTDVLEKREVQSGQRTRKAEQCNGDEDGESGDHAQPAQAAPDVVLHVDSGWQGLQCSCDA